ncbi:SpoIIE family protein phosphatase [Streptomyces sp. TLI_171]|uniref:ATP-binding SpoIIE family protein phosphatase n=1 Tax=Streptomyces sp. TLI_171 TaxID=1938859 RepID=UPI000C190605|nr:SpoIIE family protein phosphatase [Streptomyces sp. TLI_171]RKE21724.1 stage II sporulation protein E [Streptomyces sp. TLI_171]
MTLEPQGGEPEVTAFVAFLDQLFHALGISLTRYAVRCNRDKGSVSRYLSGARIAPKDFVDELLRQVAETTGRAVSPDVQQHAHRLRMAALRVRNASRHEVEELRDRLGAAERELQLAGVRERALLRSLEATEAQAAHAEQRYRQLETDRATAHYEAGPGELERRPEGPDTEFAREELRALKTELDLLRAELARARTLRHEAEERCLRLEARLLAAEAALAAQRARHEREFSYRAELESPGAVLTREFGFRVGTTPDPETTAAELCEVFVPGWADGAAVDVRAGFVDDDRPPDGWGPATVVLQRLGVTGGFGGPAAGGPVALPRTLVERVLREGVPVLAPPVEGGAPVLALPLAVRGEVFGVLQLACGSARSAYGRSEIELLAGLAERGALLLDSARMHREEPRLARALQRSMIPIGLPRTRGVRLAHRFRPGEHRAGSGGDWFDAVPLRGNRVALVVGDVMGHGLPAAQAMSRLRAGVHAFALLDVPPGQLLRHLDNLVHRLGPELLATCLYAVYDPVARTCELASAGHLPPVLLHRGGGSEQVDLPTNAPIGVGGVPFSTRTIEVPDGSTLVLCTENRVELAAQCARLTGSGWTPEQICAFVFEAPGTGDRRDDLAVLVARFDGLPRAREASHTFAPRAGEVPRVRHLVRSQLCSWGLEFVADTAELLIGELITDAVEVAHAPVEVRLVWTGRLLVEIVDDHRELPVLEHVEPLGEEGSGRGLVLVSRLADRWGAEHRPGRRVVWFELGSGGD